MLVDNLSKQPILISRNLSKSFTKAFTNKSKKVVVGSVDSAGSVDPEAADQSTLEEYLAEGDLLFIIFLLSVVQDVLLLNHKLGQSALGERGRLGAVEGAVAGQLGPRATKRSLLSGERRLGLWRRRALACTQTQNKDT